MVKFVYDHGDIITEEDFEEYAKICVQTAIDKYQKLFSFDVNLIRVRKALHACKFFIRFICNLVPLMILSFV